jgi:asparagine synthase (glutamine-hydrolysing)
LPPDAIEARVMRQEREILAARGVTLVLSGWGGDQGISYRANLTELLLHGYMGEFLKEIKALAKGSPLRFIKTLLSYTLFELFKPYRLFSNPDKDLIRFTNRHFSKIGKRRRIKYTLHYFPVKQLESGYIQNRTEQAAWMDAVCSIQHICPYLDYRVVDFAMSIPRHLYYKNGVKRYIYREAFKDILPKAIYQFTSKNDIAKSTYFTGALPDMMIKLKQNIRELDHTVFSDYIDFNQLLVRLNALPADDKKNITSVNRRIFICHNIQRILEQARKAE